MAESEETGSGLGGLMHGKILGLPGWAWIVAAGGVVGFVLLRRQSSTAASNPGNVISVIQPDSLGPGGVGGGAPTGPPPLPPLSPPGPPAAPPPNANPCAPGQVVSIFGCITPQDLYKALQQAGYGPGGIGANLQGQYLNPATAQQQSGILGAQVA